jgi:hypothetical protein
MSACALGAAIRMDSHLTQHSFEFFQNVNVAETDFYPNKSQIGTSVLINYFQGPKYD